MNLQSRFLLLRNKTNGATAHAAVLVLGALMLSACAATRWEQPAPRKSSTQSTNSTQRSSRGNPPFYEVFGQRYYVMQSSYGYKEQGVASWYGKKFHGKPTSSGEIYDMHAMTAAHKTLPLPTQVRVTNLRNGKSVIVKVNDRGPFVDNRLIDMSYAAALQLGMIKSGTTLVEVAVLDASSAAGPVLADGIESQAQFSALNPISSASAEPEQNLPEVSLFLQVGAFGEQANAQELKRRLVDSGIPNVLISYDADRTPVIYRVRLGPIAGVDEYDTLAAQVIALNITDAQLVIEPANSVQTGYSAVKGSATPDG
jgi:rare lipoprotein A